MPENSALKLANIFRTLLFKDINFTDFIFTDIIIHAKASCVQVMSVIIMSDNVVQNLMVVYSKIYDLHFGIMLS